MNNYFICATSACMERMLDAQKIYSYLEINNWRHVTRVSEADLLVISTCAFGQYEDRCAEELIMHYLRQKKPTAKLILVGCLPTINPSRLEGLGEFWAVSPTTLDILDTFLGSKVSLCNIQESNCIRPNGVSYKLLLKKFLNVKSSLRNFDMRVALGKKHGKHLLESIKEILCLILITKAYINPFLVGIRNSLFYLRISRGCLGNCSYCAKRYATGRLQSKASEQVISEFNEGLRRGKKLFYLLSEDVGCYGEDIGTNIVKLLNDIFSSAEGHDIKLIVSNLNAEWFIKYYDELENILVRNQGKILYVHIPIQSGSDRILQLMNRQYRIEDVERCLSLLRHKLPAIKLTTDIIVGFPGEDEEDFLLTLGLLKRIKFDFADIFAYESRPSTPAAGFAGCVPRELIGKRKRRLLAIQNKNAKFSTLTKKINEIARQVIRGEG